jgi:hypothetical protein
MPSLYAMALMVVSAVMAGLLEAEYTAPVVDVGFVPLMVYRMTAPLVEVDRVIAVPETTAPAAGLAVGVATLAGSPGGGGGDRIISTSTPNHGKYEHDPNQ